MSILTQVIIMAFLVEAIWETLKMVWQEGKLCKDRIGALVVGLVIAFAINVDLFVAIGLTPVFEYVGTIATGILVSRGGNYIHDLFNLLDKDNNSK